jgi:hypothetical protein
MFVNTPAAQDSSNGSDLEKFRPVIRCYRAKCGLMRGLPGLALTDFKSAIRNPQSAIRNPKSGLFSSGGVQRYVFDMLLQL